MKMVKLELFCVCVSWLTWSKKSLLHPAMKNGAFEPNIAPRKILSKLCSHSKISPEKQQKYIIYVSVNRKKAKKRLEEII